MLFDRNLDGIDVTLRRAYVRCPHCGYCNTVYGFGEDND